MAFENIQILSEDEVNLGSFESPISSPEFQQDPNNNPQADPNSFIEPQNPGIISEADIERMPGATVVDVSKKEGLEDLMNISKQDLQSRANSIENPANTNPNQTPNNGANNTGADTKNNPYYLFAEEIAGRAGIDLAEYKDKIKSSEEAVQVLLRVQEQQANQIHQEYLNTLEPEKRQYLNLTEQGLNHDEAVTANTALEVVATITKDSLSNEDNAKKVLESRYALLGMSKEEIAEEIDAAETLGQLQEKAEKYYDTLRPQVDQMVINKQKALTSAERNRLEKAKTNRENFIKSIKDTNTLVEGIPMTDGIKDKMISLLTEEVGTDANGNKVNGIRNIQLQNPQDFTKLTAFYASIGLFDIDPKTKKFTPNMSKLNGLLEESTLSKLDNMLSRQEQKQMNFSSGTILENTGSDLDFADMLAASQAQAAKAVPMS